MVTYVTLVVGRVEVLSIPARRKVHLGAHFIARLLGELNVILTGVETDMVDGAVCLVARIISSVFLLELTSEKKVFVDWGAYLLKVSPEIIRRPLGGAMAPRVPSQFLRPGW